MAVFDTFLPDWRADLQPASWKNIPFEVDASELSFGRLTPVHVFPFREESSVWVEDAGRAPASIRINGFLIGDDVRRQQLEFFNACKIGAFGTLVHPVYGQQTGSIVGMVHIRLRKDRGRYAELGFDFLSHKDRPYPATTTAAQSGVAPAASSAQGAAGDRFNARIGSPSASASQGTA